MKIIYTCQQQSYNNSYPVANNLQCLKTTKGHVQKVNAQKIPQWFSTRGELTPLEAFGYVGRGLVVIKYQKKKCAIGVQKVSANGFKCPIAGSIGEEKSFSFYPLRFKGRPTNGAEKKKAG